MTHPILTPAFVSLQTNVPNLRLEYRRRTLLEELALIRTKRSVDSQAYEA